MPSLFLRFWNYRIIGGRAEDHRRIKGGRRGFYFVCLFAVLQMLIIYVFMV
jgi:hypothetical protein